MAKPNWITVNPSSGTGAGIFRITFAQNTSTSERSGIVTVKSIGGLTREIKVTQAGKVSKGKITFLYTGEEIPQEYVGYSLFIGESNADFIEIFANYGRIEAIADDSVAVNFDNMSQENLEMTLATINGDLTDMDEVYFGVSSSDDPSIDWIPLLLVNDPGDEEFTNQNMAAKIQSVFNGTSEIIHGESLFTPSEVVCSWGLSAANLLLASITQETLEYASTSEVTFKVYADLYPDGQRLEDNSMINIEVGQFTLGLLSGQSLNQPVLVRTSTNSQFKWAKEYSEVALCRFTIKCNYGDIITNLSKNLIINGKTFTKHEGSGFIYFENTEGIPLRKTTDSQTLNISSNYPTLTFDRLV